jgi:hypothetical protein
MESMQEDGYDFMALSTQCGVRKAVVVSRLEGLPSS